MTFRRLNAKYLFPAATTLMIFGIVALCQPWSLFLHRYGMTLTLLGFIAFLVTTHIPDEEEEAAPREDDEDVLP